MAETSTYDRNTEERYIAKFPELEFGVLTPIESVMQKLIDRTNEEIGKRKPSEQITLENKALNDIFEEPELPIEAGDIIEPVIIYLNGSKINGKTGLMPLYRVANRKYLQSGVELWFGYEYTRMLYKLLKGNFPTKLAEVIPALKRVPYNKLRTMKIKVTIKRYAKDRKKKVEKEEDKEEDKEGKEKLLEEYTKQLSQLLDTYNEAGKPEEQQQPTTDQETLANISTKDTAFIENLEALLKEKNHRTIKKGSTRTVRGGF